ncbi:MAG: glutamate--cysteine ligase [Pseudomonadales bacterium]|nr:glutamate--cysteine ligase [Pseudomonadales bacterium]
MANRYLDHLNLIRQQPALLSSIANLSRGIEKESLRVYADGTLAQSTHPKSLGSALCHSKITTDYSEALLEFITPVHSTIKGALAELSDIHHFTYQKLAQQDELLWTSSMPCQLGEEADIPVAIYGSSNVATMKTVYRYGLGKRYGRQMQTISGIHYNFSVSDKFWANYQRALGNTDRTCDFKTQQYFGLIRNFRRYVPLFVYLFGASPALCRSFLKGGQEHNLHKFDEHSWYGPHATSLRMGDLGYQSSEQDSLFVCYNCIDDYIDSLKAAIKDPLPSYEKIGLFDSEGQQQQLNTSLLQIENEFYSTIRPKRVAASGEAPLNALARSGVEYIEVRCVDINPFSPIGIDTETAKFLDLFLLYCLLSDSPKLNALECQQTEENLKLVVEQGRKPGLQLQQLNQQAGQTCSFSEWGQTLLNDMRPLAKLLDSLKANEDYQGSLAKQSDKMQDASLTPSAQVLQQMTENQLTFAEFSRRQSQHWQQYFTDKEISSAKLARFEAYAEDSLAQQQTLEAADNESFSDYLADFYAQY